MLTRHSQALLVLIFFAFLTLLVVGPYWQMSGLPGGAIDTLMHLHRSAAVSRAFVEGVYWPRWFPGVYNGLGAPVFHHYSPGLYWLVASFHGMGLGLDQALKFIITAALLLAGCSAYAWLRFAFSPVASLAGCAVLLLHPHILTRAIYYEGSLARLIGLLVLPVCLWSITALHKRSRILYWCTAVGSGASLVLIHAPTALVGAVLFFFYWILMGFGYRRPGGLVRCAVAALLVVVLTAAFWLPAWADRVSVQVDEVRHGLFSSQSNYLFSNWWNLFGFQSPILDSRAGNPLLSLLNGSFGMSSWLVLAAGLASALFGRQAERRLWALSGCFFTLATLTLSLSISEHLWDSIALLRLVPFPYRLPGIASFGLLPAAAAAIDVWPASRRVIPAFAFVIASFLVLFPYLFPSHTSHTPFREVKSLTVEDTHSFEQTTGYWGTTAFNEYLVRGADFSIIAGRTPEPEAARVTWRSSHEAVADLSNQTGPMLLRLHFHSGWSAGDRATLAPGTGGWLEVFGLKNTSQPLLIRWEGTLWQKWGERISLFGLLVSFSCLLYFALRQPRWIWKSERLESNGLQSGAGPGSSHFALLSMTGLILLLVAFRSAIDSSSRGPFTLQSPPGRLAFAVRGQPVTLGDRSSTRVSLLGWELVSRADPEPGDVVRVRLYWQPHGRITEELRSFVHLYSPSIKHSWAVENIRTGNIPDSRHWDPDRYYMDELRLKLPSDLPPIRFSLAAGLTSVSNGRLSVHGSRDGVVELTPVDIAPTRPGFLQKARPSSKAQAATGDGLYLQGYDLLLEPEAPILRLFWETGDGIETDWTTYVHLHDDQGTRVAQYDGPALAGVQPTSQWHTNALYIDRRRLDLQPGLQPGNYLLRVGLYNLETGQRLPFQPHDAAQEQFENGQLLIPFLVASPIRVPD